MARVSAVAQSVLLATSSDPGVYKLRADYGMYVPLDMLYKRKKSSVR